jgi:hypothetical protein
MGRSRASRREKCSSIAATIRRCSASGGSGMTIRSIAPLVSFKRVVPLTTEL